MLQCGAAFVNRSSTIVRKSQQRQTLTSKSFSSLHSRNARASASSYSLLVRALGLFREMYARTHSQIFCHLPRLRTRVSLRNSHRRDCQPFAYWHESASVQLLPRPLLDRDLHRAREIEKILGDAQYRSARQPGPTAFRRIAFRPLKILSARFRSAWAQSYPTLKKAVWQPASRR